MDSHSSLLVNAISLVAFGMCTYVNYALVVRFVHGLIDGTVPIVKTIQTEISNKSNIALVSGLYFVGCAVGG